MPPETTCKTYGINVIDIVENSDGTSDIVVEYNKEFVKWFNEHQGLKRFSKKRLQKFVTESLENYLDLAEQNEKITYVPGD